MPFRLSNAPSAFQKFMNEIFSNLLDICVIVYLDDILIYSNSLEDYKRHMKEVLSRLRKHKLYASPSKCSFHQREIEFLGSVLNPEGIQMDKNKVKVIQDWPTPCWVKDIQAFLGFANFYRRFIHNYANMTTPLTTLTQKNATWNWTESRQQAFNTLKQMFISAPVLTHWDPELPLIVKTDASDYVIVAIISTQTQGDIHPIAFHLWMLSPAELNYNVHDKELLAIFDAFKKWRHYLEGTPSPVVVFTDHKNLEWFCESKTLSRRQARWSEFLSQFNITIKFRLGRLGTKPNALTRRWNIYHKGNMADFATANPQNLRPIFNPNQLADRTDTTHPSSATSKIANLLDQDSLLTKIKAAVMTDPALKEF